MEQQLPLIPPCDRETFEKVWKRVMPQPSANCPIALYSEGVGGAIATVVEVPTTTTLVPSTPAPTLPVTHTAVPTPVIPREGDVPCLGEGSAVHGTQLQALISHALESWHIYQMLARRGHGTGGKLLATMAADKRRHAKRLATAYFLISGVRYWPVSEVAPPQRMAYPAALRHCFHRAQRSELSLHAAAQETGDPALYDLYLELAQDEATHTWHLRGLLEQLP